MSKRTNRKPDQVREKPFRLPKNRQYLKVTCPENGAIVKITGPDSALIDDFKGTVRNSYQIIKESRVFFDIGRREFYVYLTVKQYERTRPQ